MARRWKLLVGLGAALIALGLIPDWPPRTDPALPETGTFFLLLGTVVGAAGLAIGLRQEP